MNKERIKTYYRKELWMNKEKIEKHETLQSREVTLDIARAFAILCVVLCHCTEAIYNMNSNSIYYSTCSQIFKTVSFTIGRLGVPFFLFISGALLLRKQIEKDEDVFKFYKHNLLPIVITTEIWIIIYNIFLSIIGAQTFNIKILIKEMLFLTQAPFNNMWYMPMIIGIYIAVPFIAKIVKSFSHKILFLILSIVLFYTSALTTINVIRDILELPRYSYIIDLNFLGGIYGAYVLLGYLIHTKMFRNVKLPICYIGSAIFFVLTVIVQAWAYKNGKIYNVWYDCLFLVFGTAFLFELFNRIDICSPFFQKVTKYISKISLGIFFIHVILINRMKEYVIILNIMNPLKVMILFLITISLSVMIIFLLSKVKIAKKRLFLIK